MAGDNVLGALEKTSPAELQRIISENLRCPLTWDVETYGADFVEILVHRWARVVSVIFPDELDPDLLMRDEFGSYLTDVSDNDRGFAIIEAIDGMVDLAYAASVYRDACHKRYMEDCRTIAALTIQTPADRRKHYPPRRAPHDVIRTSKTKPNVGILAPFVTPKLQLYMLWRALADAFDRMDLPGATDPQHLIANDEFDLRCKALFVPSHVRLSMESFDTVGYFNGEPASFLIFDIHYDASIIHCFPSRSAVANSFSAILDDLQGANQAYESGNWNGDFPV